MFNTSQSESNSTVPLTGYDLWLRKGWPVWLLAGTVFIADQLTKQVILNWLRYGESWPAEGFLRFTHARNTGAAFSLFEGQSTILSIVAILAVGLILWLYKTSGGGSLLLRLALALQLGGAFGNLLDRFRYGYVVDFFDVGPWPIFNVADSAISVGIAFLIAYIVFGQPSDAPGNAEPADIESVAVGTCARCERRRIHVQNESRAVTTLPSAAAPSLEESDGATSSEPRPLSTSKQPSEP